MNDQIRKLGVTSMFLFGTGVTSGTSVYYLLCIHSFDWLKARFPRGVGQCLTRGSSSLALYH